jgi:hypothetical protein
LTEDPNAKPAERTAITPNPALPDGGKAAEDGPNKSPLPAPRDRLASLNQIGVASLLGGPVAGLLLISLNNWKCRRRLAFGVMVAATVLAVPANCFILWDASYTIRSIGQFLRLAFTGVFVTVVMAALFRTGIWDSHRTRGGTSASVWVVGGCVGIGIAVAMCCPLLDPVLGLLFPGSRLQVTATERVDYDNTVTEAEARTLGEELKRQLIFEGKRKSSVTFKKDSQGYVVTFWYDKEPYDRLIASAEIKSIFTGWARAISRAFGGKPVRIVLYDWQSSVEWTTGPVRDNMNK